jgi:hypothetical protein
MTQELKKNIKIEYLIEYLYICNKLINYGR